MRDLVQVDFTAYRRSADGVARREGNEMTCIDTASGRVQIEQAGRITHGNVSADYRGGRFFAHLGQVDAARDGDHCSADHVSQRYVAADRLQFYVNATRHIQLEAAKHQAGTAGVRAAGFRRYF